MTYNSEIIFDTVKPIWHDAPFSISRLVRNGELIMIRLSWGPHDEREI